MALILKSKATKEIPIQTGERVEVYQEKKYEKRGKWSMPKPVISVNHAARSVTVPGSNNRVVSIALENIRNATPPNNLASTVQLGIDVLDELVDEILDKNMDFVRDATVDGDYVEVDIRPIRYQNDFASDFSSDSCNALLLVGDRISIYWPDDE